MQRKGWVFFGNEQPPSMHLTIDPLPHDVIESLLLDLRSVVAAIRTGHSVTGDLQYGLAKAQHTARWIEQARRLSLQAKSLR
jgi:hypothetical protein